jgi:hypothetical protein
MCKYYLPVEKPEDCTFCPAYRNIDGIPWCKKLYKVVWGYAPPPANCPIIPMPDVEALTDKIARLERLNAILKKAIIKDEREASNG